RQTHLFNFVFLRRICATPSSALFPYTTLFRSRARKENGVLVPLSSNETTRTGVWAWKVPKSSPMKLVRVLNLPDKSAVELPKDGDRKSTRLNSSHVSISYAVFCLKKKKQTASG